MDSDIQKPQCPECDNPIVTPDPKVGKILQCPACGTESEVVEINPVKLAALEEEK